MEKNLDNIEKKIIIEDKGHASFTGWLNPNEATGALLQYTEKDRIAEIMQRFKAEAMAFPPIPGRIVFYEGGEFRIFDFADPYQLIGWMVCNLGHENVIKIQGLLVRTAPDKFKGLQQMAEQRQKEMDAERKHIKYANLEHYPEEQQKMEARLKEAVQ